MPSCNPVEGNPNTSEMDSVVKICARVYALTSLRLTASIGRAWEHGCVKTCPDGIRKQFTMVEIMSVGARIGTFMLRR